MYVLNSLYKYIWSGYKMIEMKILKDVVYGIFKVLIFVRRL